jgi:hypothetical protein
MASIHQRDTVCKVEILPQLVRWVAAVKRCQRLHIFLIFSFSFSFSFVEPNVFGRVLGCGIPTGGVKHFLSRQNLTVCRKHTTKYLNRLFRVETNGCCTALRYVRVGFPAETRHGLDFTRNSNGQQAQRRCPLTTVKPPRCFGLPFVHSHYFFKSISVLAHIGWVSLGHEQRPSI